MVQKSLKKLLRQMRAVFTEVVDIVGASNFVTFFGLYGHERTFCLKCALMFERIWFASTHQRIGKDLFYIFNFISTQNV